MKNTFKTLLTATAISAYLLQSRFLQGGTNLGANVDEDPIRNVLKKNLKLLELINPLNSVMKFKFQLVVMVLRVFLVVLMMHQTVL